MNNSLLKKSLFTILVVSVLLLASFSLLSPLEVLDKVGAVALGALLPTGPAQNDYLRVTFIDVGEGDSCLIQTPGGKNILIDGGRGYKGKDVLPFLKKKGIRRIDTLVATHPDMDHIGGFLAVLDSNIKIDKVLDPGHRGTSYTYQDFLLKVAERKDIKYYQPRAGQVLDWGEGLKVQVLSPAHLFRNANDSSIVIKLTYGRTSFLLTGDAGYPAENEMIANFGGGLRSTILKAGHHGAKTSTSSFFLNYVRPKIAIISVGPNSYGHPFPEVLNRLREVGARIYCTGEVPGRPELTSYGNITITTDGKKCWMETER